MAQITRQSPFRKAKNIRKVGMSRSRVVGMSGLFDDLVETARDAAGLVYSGDSASPSKTSTGGSTSGAGSAGGAGAVAPATSGPAITGLRNIQNTLLGFQISVGPSGADGVWGPCTAQAIRTLVSRQGRAQAVTFFGEDIVHRAETTTGQCSTSGGSGGGSGGGGGDRGGDVVAETPPVTPPATGIFASLSNLFGGSNPLSQLLPRTSTSPLADPLFLGLVAVGIVGGVVGFSMLKKGKKKAAPALAPAPAPAPAMTQNKRRRKRSRRK